MGRNQDRAFMQQLNKDKDWYRKLSTDKKRFIGWYIEQKVIENDNITAKILDKCFQSAISDNTDLELLDLKKIITEANEYMREYQEFLVKEKEGFNMIENKEVIEKVKDKIKSYISGKMDKAKGLKLLKSEFSLPNAELSDLWLQTKTELGVNTKNKHTPVKKEEVKKEVAADKEIKEPVPIRKEDLEALKELVKEKPKESTLKVIKKTIEVQGTYGFYIKASDGVRTEQRHFKDIKDLETYKQGAKAEISKQEQNIKEQINELEEKSKKLQEEKEREFNFIKEVAEVFNL